MAEKLLTIRDVACWLRVSESTVYRLTRSGQLPCLRLGRLVRYSPEAVRQFVQENVVDFGSTIAKIGA